MQQQTKTVPNKEMLALRERLRLARDHMHRSQLEMERALIQLGRIVGQWFFCQEEQCRCGITNKVSTIEIYEWVTTLSRRCSSLFNQAEERIQEPLIQMRKRGSRRKLPPASWIDWGHHHPIPETELPKITPAPKEPLEIP